MMMAEGPGCLERHMNRAACVRNEAKDLSHLPYSSPWSHLLADWMLSDVWRTASLSPLLLDQ